MKKTTKTINICSGATYVDNINEQTIVNYNGTVNNYNGTVNNYHAAGPSATFPVTVFDATGSTAEDAAEDAADDGGTAEALPRGFTPRRLPSDGAPPQDALTDADRRVADVLRRMDGERMFRHAYDYAWIMKLFINGGDLNLPHRFYSAISFAKYLRDDLGIAGSPSPSTLTRKLCMVRGRFPNWTFDDHADSREERRRINLASCFLSYYRKN